MTYSGEFQYQYGAIDASANKLTGIASIKFQYQYGAIDALPRHIYVDRRSRFQYQYGAIDAESIKLTCPSDVSFNTNMVRLMLRAIE